MNNHTKGSIRKKIIAIALTTSMAGGMGAALPAVQIISGSSVAFADTIDKGKCGTDVYWSFDDKGVLTIYGSGDVFDYEGQADQGWGDYLDDIKSVVIEDGVTRIGNSAFKDCRYLESVAIADSVESIGKYAFYYCLSINDLDIGEGVKTIENDAFGCCIELTDLTIPKSVENIGDNVFYYCTGLTGIKVDSGNKNYDSRNNCNALIETASNTLIAGCRNSTIPDGIETIGYGAFGECQELTDINIPDSVTKIESLAFYNCKGLKTAVIGKSVKSIEKGAFYGLDNFTDVYYMSDKTDWNNIEIIRGNEDLTNANIHYLTFSDKWSCNTSTHWHAPTEKTFGNLKSNEAQHKLSTITAKATLTKDGSVAVKCSVCGYTKSSVKIAYPKTISLSQTSYTYNGKVKKPAVTVKDSNGKKIAASNYTVSYSNKNSKAVGTYTVKIKFKGNYSGTKALTYKILPKTVTDFKLAAGKGAFTAGLLKPVTKTTGYQVQYAADSKFTKTKTVDVTKVDAITKSVNKLSSNKKYYVRLRTCKTVNGKKYYSAWSKAKTVTTR